MSGLSEERRKEIGGLTYGALLMLTEGRGTSVVYDAIRDLLAESAALRTERDEALQRGKNLEHRLKVRGRERAELEARLGAPASPDDLARVASDLAAEVCRCADCVPYGQPIPCDRARIADRLRNPLAVALARLTPPTGTAAGNAGETRMGESS